jgi:hypothetical protein
VEISCKCGMNPRVPQSGGKLSSGYITDGLSSSDQLRRVGMLVG